MSDTVIRVENLGKRYIIGHQKQQPYKTLRDVITERANSLKNKLLKPLGNNIDHQNRKEFWALTNVSFEIKQGEVIGIIGRNGAGKSTLLKILSRITEPTKGRIYIKGKVSSLLEVGTGFHPELTGIENIYLNGAILGMSKAEIKRKFDEIVSFAEVEKFLYTPVKYYSSGMYVRLAFAVAAHLQPEILLIDEVLAVGDIEFQKKCIGKMEKVAEEGRTVLVVSHSISTVKALCSKAVLLEQGQVKAMDLVDCVIREYLNFNQADTAEKIVKDEDHLTGIGKLRVQRIRLINSVSNLFRVYWQQPISISLDIEVFEQIEEVAFGAGIRTIDGTHVYTVHHDDNGNHQLWKFEPGEYTIEFTLENSLRPGLYKLHIGADQGHTSSKNICWLDIINLEILDHSENGEIPLQNNSGIVIGDSTWKAPKILTG